MAINTEAPISEVLYEGQNIPLAGGASGQQIYEHRINMKDGSGNFICVTVVTTQSIPFTFDTFCKYFYDKGFYRSNTSVMCSGIYTLNSKYASVCRMNQFTETGFVLLGARLGDLSDVGPTNPMNPQETIDASRNLTFTDVVIAV